MTQGLETALVRRRGGEKPSCNQGERDTKIYDGDSSAFRNSEILGSFAGSVKNTNFDLGSAQSIAWELRKSSGLKSAQSKRGKQQELGHAVLGLRISSSIPGVSRNPDMAAIQNDSQAF